MAPGFHTTSKSLLAELARPNETEQWQKAWVRFVGQYGEPIQRLCRRCGVREADLKDVMQEVLLKLMSSMVTFECQRWLKVVVKQAIEEFLVELKGATPGSDEARIRDVLRAVGRDDGADEPTSPFPPAPAEVRARQLLREPTMEEKRQFEARWWEAGTAIWDESRPSFDDFFGPVVTRCCLRWGLEGNSAETAARLLRERIARVHETLQEDSLPKFRSWLSAVVRNAAKDCLQKLRAMAQAGDVRIVASPETIADDKDFEKDLVLRELLDEAERRLRDGGGVSERDWEVYHRIHHDGQKSPEVANDLRLRVANVYVIATRVRKKLAEEIRRLQEPRHTEKHGTER